MMALWIAVAHSPTDISNNNVLMLVFEKSLFKDLHIVCLYGDPFYGLSMNHVSVAIKGALLVSACVESVMRRALPGRRLRSS